MVKLTPELINSSMQYINPCRDRELDLRGYKIPQVENMGATLDQFDTVDFSENDLRKLDGFPYLPRLKCLLLNNNRIVRLSETLHECLPNINTLILTGNNLQELCDLDALTHLPKLETLCLLMNPVATKPNYREYIAFKFPNLRLLDFRKIKKAHRKEALELFKSKRGKDILKEIAKKTKSNGTAFAAGGAANGSGSDAQQQKLPHQSSVDVQQIRDAIKNATTLQEVERLTGLIQSGGQLTEEFLNDPSK